jgi:hypothetical protein
MNYRLSVGLKNDEAAGAIARRNRLMLPPSKRTHIPADHYPLPSDPQPAE